MAYNKQTEKTPMPEQDPAVRVSNFDEVATGYTEEMAVNEATRCLNCKHRPCVDGCPVNVQIPDFIKQITEGSFEDAYKTIRQTNSLPAVCGRVCPQESQCEAKCVRGIKGEPVAIGRLERFAADYHMEHGQEKITPPEPNGHRVAIVGSGPAGLTCAGDLAKLGYDVTIYEAFHTPGGVLVYGIPEFRLPKSIVQREIDSLRARREDKDNMVIGKILSVDELSRLKLSLWARSQPSSFLSIPARLIGVMSANEFLTRINPMKAYKDEYDTL